jgi:F-type H+-transporting ATPase subunit b
MHFDAPFWVAFALLIFIGILIWKGVHRFAASALDKRAEEIRKQLEEARSLREEAQAILAQHQREQRDAAKTADDIVAQADREAKLAVKMAEEGLEQAINRRMELAEEKIAQAEASAVKEVRSVAARVATAAAHQLLTQHLTGAGRDKLVDDAIDQVDKKLH